MKTIDSEIRNIIKYTVSSSYASTIILNNDNVKLIMKYGNNVNDLKKDKDFLSKSIQMQKGIESERKWHEPLPLTIWLARHPAFSPITGFHRKYMTLRTAAAMSMEPRPNIPNAILDVVWDIISDFIFPGKKLAKIRKNITEYIKTAKKEYINYVESHEKYICDVQAQIDIINKRKPIMKDYILQKVVNKLCELGIDSQLGDYPMEFIDYRIFKMNEEFSYINKEFQLIQNDQYAQILEYIPMIPVFPYILTPILVKKKIKQLEEKFSQIQKQSRLVFEKMNSDNQKIKNLSIALNNIANIYTDINSKFIPTIENILNIISVKYYNNIKEIPDDLLYLLRTTTKFLKELAERRIIPKGNSSDIVDSVIEASNDISVTYENLRNEFYKAA